MKTKNQAVITPIPKSLCYLFYSTLLTHDRGDSVWLALLQNYQSVDASVYTIEDHFMLNGYPGF